MGREELGNGRKTTLPVRGRLGNLILHLGKEGRQCGCKGKSGREEEDIVWR